MEDINVRNIGENKKGNFWTTQLYSCQLRTNFDVFKPALVPEKKKLSQNTAFSRKNSTLTQDSPTVPQLNLKGCSGGDSYSMTTSSQGENFEQSVFSSTDYKSSPMKFVLPELSSRVIQDLQNANNQASKTLATIHDINADVATLQKKEIMHEDERRHLEHSQVKLESYFNQFQSLAKKVTQVVDCRIDEHEDDNPSDTESPSGTVSPSTCGTAEKSEDEAEETGSTHNGLEEQPSANVTSEKSETILIASARVRANALLAAEMKKELGPEEDGQSTSTPSSTPGRGEPVLSEGRPENFLDSAQSNISQNSVMAITDRLSETLHMQLLMAKENRELQQTRYNLQEALATKESEVDNLRKKVENLQKELWVLKRENMATLERNAFKEHVAKITDLEKGVEKEKMEEELVNVEKEMTELKLELSLFQNERQQLLLARQQAKSCASFPPSDLQEGFSSKHSLQHFDVAPESLTTVLEEIASLREHNKHLSSELEKVSAENKGLVEVRTELKSLKSKYKQLMEMSRQSAQEIEQMTKSKTDLEDELNDVRECLEESNAEAGEYRRKYLEAQQRVEELSTEIQHRQKQLESCKEEAANEVRLMKSQCQEKFASVQHLPSMLNEAQMKLQESQQLHAIAEKSMQDMKNEMVTVINENTMLQKTLEAERNSRLLNSTERGKLTAQISAVEDKCVQLRNENSSLQTRLRHFDETVEQMERQIIEKAHEASELRKLLDSSRQDSTRQLSRTKDRAEMGRRSMQEQISNLERELAAARAAEKNAYKEKDELRQKMQVQIDELTESLEEGQTRWRGLHAHVTSLQNTLQPAIITNGVSLQPQEILKALYK